MKLKRELNSFQNTSSDAATNKRPYSRARPRMYSPHCPLARL